MLNWCVNPDEIADRRGVGQTRGAMMKTANAKYQRQRPGLVAYASVTVCVDLSSSGSGIAVSVAEGESSGPNLGDWRVGAAEGARFGLEVAGATARVEVIEIQGTIVDTYPAAVAAAATLAVWKSLSHEPSQAEIDLLDSNVRRHSGPFVTDVPSVHFRLEKK